MAALVKHIPLPGMAAKQGVGRRIDSAFGEKLLETLAIEPAGELNHGKDPATFTRLGSHWSAR
jgi:hypothetical protein